MSDSFLTVAEEQVTRITKLHMEMDKKLGGPVEEIEPLTFGDIPVLLSQLHANQRALTACVGMLIKHLQG